MGRPGRASADEGHRHPGWDQEGKASLAELSSAHPAQVPMPSGAFSWDNNVLNQKVAIPHLISFSSRISMSSVSSLHA